MNKIGKYVKLNGDAGHVDLSIPAKQGADLDLRGDNVKLNITGASFDGRKEKETIVGKLNGGGPMVKIETGSGSIRVH